MCGVVAALGHSVDLTEPMKRLAHRGIRGRVAHTPHGGVGHVRLPIVGLGEEHDQPRNYKDLFLLGFVGEVLDFRERYPDMACDTDLVVKNWRAFGPHCLQDHDGFWGIVVLQDRYLHVLTDYLGQKPMYYRTDYPCAASEPDALIPFAPVTLDRTYLAACVKWGYCPDLMRTPYNEIKHVRPGEHVVLDVYGLVSRRTVDVLEPLDWKSGDIREEIELAVKRRVLSSDVQVACLLSGGLDSSIVHALASRDAQPVPYFVAQEDGSDDEDYWRAVGLVQRPSLNPWGSKPPDAITLSRVQRCRYADVGTSEALRVMQEPIDLGSLRPQIALSRVVGQRVCLTGDGADELFGGYQRSMRYDSQYSDVFHELPAWHLPRLDRVMMRERIEVRSPFLARRVVRLALSLPHELRQDKRFLRALFSGLLPPEVTTAPKKALRSPEIAHDREYYSRQLVHMFVENFDEKYGGSVDGQARLDGS